MAQGLRVSALPLVQRASGNAGGMGLGTGSDGNTSPSTNPPSISSCPVSQNAAEGEMAGPGTQAVNPLEAGFPNQGAFTALAVSNKTSGRFSCG